MACFIIMGTNTSIFEICKGTTTKEKLVSSGREAEKQDFSLGKLSDKIEVHLGYSYFSESDLKLLSVKYSQSSLNDISPPLNYQTSENIGQGSFGRVLFSANLDTGELMAVKQIPLLDFNPHSCHEQVKKLESEVEILSKLSHPNIVRYLGTQKSRDYLLIFMEYVSGGTISSLLQRYGKLNETLIRIYAQQILEGLEYLHFHNIIHRDIKGANVLVTSEGVCKLADFGSAKKILNYDDMSYKSLKGTMNWMAPEVMRQEGHGRFADIWSFGCLLVEMATGKPPWYYKTNQVAVMLHVCSTLEAPQVPSDLSSLASDFILSCFKRNPSDRPNTSKLLRHPFLTGLTLNLELSLPKSEDFLSDRSKYSTDKSFKKQGIKISLEVHRNSIEVLEDQNPEFAIKSPFFGTITAVKFKEKRMKEDEDFCLIRPSNQGSVA